MNSRNLGTTLVFVVSIHDQPKNIFCIMYLTHNSEQQTITEYITKRYANLPTEGGGGPGGGGGAIEFGGGGPGGGGGGAGVDVAIASLYTAVSYNKDTQLATAT